MEVRWRKSGMPVTREGRFVYASSEDLTAWVGTESGKNEPVQVASEAEDLVADLKQGFGSNGRIGEDGIGGASSARYNRESSME